MFKWDEFVNEMLLKGEVEKILILDSNITVILRPGAIYKGRQLIQKTFSVYDPAYASIIEEKIREVERNIGIKAGINNELSNSKL